MIKYVHLKKHFDAIKMQEEVSALEESFWKPHYNEKQYEGEWTTLPLRSINGNIQNSVSIQSSSLQHNMAYRDTILLKDCFYLQSVINFFLCEKMAVRLMKLNPGAVIKEHADLEMSFEEGEARFHIPIITNDKVDFFIEEEKIPMKEGDCWYLNLSLKHRVNNFGKTSRIHLVIDCKVNDWLKALLFEDGQARREIKQKTGLQYSASDKIKIVEQLRLMNTPTSLELADKLEKEED
jgi:mannose-6-phosphate isomerase-like protein (cupin superfamily)